jgi:CubicO group peptidase (beta-lactamase class C family)
MQYKADRLVRDGEGIRLLADAEGERPASVVSEGRYDRDNDRISLYFPTRGGSYDFRRLGDREPSDFYPRGHPSAAYSYRAPPAMNDGWAVASLGDVGMDPAVIEAFIRELIADPIDSPSSPDIHAVLIARHGKLVLEEYFHGEHRERPHDTRSAGKSLASDMAGAAMHAGHRLAVDARVYEVMHGGTMPANLEPRKRALTLEHLLTMSSGLDCDEEDQSSPGHEDKLAGSDMYPATLALPMVREPGEKAVYCSVGANLAGGVVARAAREPSLRLFQTLLAGPLQIERYYMGTSSSLDYYLGGGARLLPRDFLKLAQLHVSGGTWNGRRVYSADWSRRATAPLVRFSEESRARYGYLWWVYDFPHEDRTVRAYFASGNGGQLSIGIDELDLAVVFLGGNYNDWETGLVALREYLPKHILPAIRREPDR